MIALFNGITATDQKWLIRIILKNIRIGLGTKKLLSLLRYDADDLFARHNSLKQLCITLENPSTAAVEAASINNMSIEPGNPFRPMLCERISISNLDQLVANDDYYVETKMDGERFQIHLANERYHYFSRRGFDYTSNFGADVSVGSLTPDLTNAFKVQVSNCVLDGEMMVWNRHEEIYHIKAEHTDVKSLPRNHPTLRPSFCVYDVLFLNGVCLLRKPYAERIRLLQTLIRQRPGVLTLSQPVRIRDGEHIVQCLNEAFDNCEEGVVIKRADSVYSPGERKAGWCKIKPDVCEW